MAFRAGFSGLLHHPGYRQKYADNLKRELPRIPFAPSSPSPRTRGEGRGEGFWAFAKAGEKLAKLHLDYEKLKPWDLGFVETPGIPLGPGMGDRPVLGLHRQTERHRFRPQP